MTTVSPLRAHGFEDRGEQLPVHGGDLGDVKRLAPVGARLLHALPGGGAAGAVTQGARQVATAPRRHGYSGRTPAVAVIKGSEGKGFGPQA